MHAAVIEFDPLPDPVRPATEHHDLAPVGGLGFILLLVGGIQIRGIGSKLGRAGINPLVHWAHAQTVPVRAHLIFFRLEQPGQPAI